MSIGGDLRRWLSPKTKLLAAQMVQVVPNSDCARNSMIHWGNLDPLRFDHDMFGFGDGIVGKEHS